MTRPIRFCLLATFYPPWNFGGDGIQVQRLARALAGRGHHVTVVTSPAVHHLFSRERPAPPAEGPGIEVVPLRDGLPTLTARYLTGRPVGARRRLERLFDRGFDVLHFQNPSLLGAPGLLAMGDGIKLYTAHEQWLLCPSHLLWRRGGRVCEDPPCWSCEISHLRPPQPWRRTSLLERSLRHLDALIAPSRTSAGLHQRFAELVRLEVLPNFVPTPAAAPATEDGKEHPVRRPFFLYAGRLEPIKGIEGLIDAFRRRRSEDLVIAGDGNLSRRLRRRAADLEHVRFTGLLSQDQLDPLYREALAVILPTLGHEVMPSVALEAFARGTPAIVRRFGALEELAETTGAALAFASPSELGAALETVASDEAVRRGLGERARAAHRRRFSEHAHLDRYMSLIGRIARERGDPALAEAAESGIGVPTPADRAGSTA